MEEIKCEQVGLLSGEKWEKMHDISRRVYSPEGLSPTLHTCGGGNLEPKIMVKSANMKGYETATLGDSINLSFPKSTTRRGRVGKGVVMTLDCKCEQGVIEPLVGALRGRPFGKGNKQRLEIQKSGLSNTLTSVQKDNVVVEPTLPIRNYRIRKLTPRECFRLMGVKDEDFDKVAKNQSNSSLYHLAGDSIVTTVLMGIFKKLF